MTPDDKNAFGVLYTVATPIGNLSDITYRAIEILNSVDLIAAEDTRTTSVLLRKYNISTRLISYHKFNEKERADIIIQKLLEGNNIALVSDAGTPLISDPGNVLVRLANENKIKVVPIGGISAVTTFLSSISREGESFKFIGFLPRVKNKIEEIIINNSDENLIFYESPERIKKTFDTILLLDPDIIISVGRELTKKFEEIKTDTVSNLIEYYKTNPIKGEIVCMLHSKKTKNEIDFKLKNKIISLKKAGFSAKDTSNILEITDKANKNEIKKIYQTV